MPKQRDRYRSGFEERIARQLEVAGVKFEYEKEKYKYRTRVTMGICGKCDHTTVYQQRTYTPDFLLVPSGIRIEVKGRLTAKDRSKLAAVVEQNPSLDLRLIFGQDNKINKNSNTRYSDWANQHNIPFHLKVIPSEWLVAQGPRHQKSRSLATTTDK